MKVTKQQKIAMGLLGLAVVAFLGDRFVLGGGEASTEVAEAVTPANGPASTTADTGEAQASAGLPMAALARKMEAICVAEGLTPGVSADAFTPPTSWLPAPEARPDTPQGPVVSSRVADFRGKHKLTALMKTGKSGQGLAVVNGHALRVGDVYEGLVVRSITERSITLGDGAGDIELELPDSGIASVR